MSAELFSQRLLLLFADVSLKGLLFTVLAAAALRLVRSRRAAVRHRVWMGVVATMLLLTVCSVLLPGLSVRVLPGWSAPSAAPAPAASAAPRPLPGVEAELPIGLSAAAEATVPAGPAPARQERLAPSGPSLLAAVYLLGFAVMLAHWALAFRVYRRLVAEARPLVDRTALDCLKRLTAASGLAAAPALLSSRSVQVPLTVGFLRPRIVLPEESRDWPLSKLESVLAHEIAHVGRRDTWFRLLSSFNRCVYWFHPVAWLLPRRLSLYAEQACDELAIRWTGRRRGYARDLLEVAQGLCAGPHRVLGGVAMARHSEIKQRIETILSPDAPLSRRRSPLATALCTALVAGCVLAGVVFRFAPASATEPVVSTRPERWQGLASPEPVERARAAIALRQSGERDPGAIPSLVQNLGDRAPVNRRLEGATEKRTDPGIEAAQALGRYGDAAIEPLRGALGAPQEEKRKDAAVAAGLTGSRQADELLVPVLEDRSPEVRTMAAWGLGNLGDAAGVGALTESLRSDADPAVRAMAAWALGRIGSSEALDALRAAQQDSDEGVRRMADWAQHMIRSGFRVEVSPRVSVPVEVPGVSVSVDVEPRVEAPAGAELAARLDDGDYRVRLHAVRTLAATGGTEAVTDLRKALRKDPYFAVREEAVAALAAIEGAGAVADLRAALEDGDYRVRLEAIEAFASFADPATTRAIESALDDSLYLVRQEAAEVLARRGDARALEVLLRDLRDEHHRVRSEAAWALGGTGQRRAVESLIAAAGDPDPRVRRAIVAALGELGDPRAREALEKAVADQDQEVSAEARKALAALAAAKQQ